MKEHKFQYNICYTVKKGRISCRLTENLTNDKTLELRLHAKIDVGKQY